MRSVAAILLVVAGCVALFLAWGPLQNLYGYRDGAVSTYLLFGLPLLAIAVAAFLAAWRLSKR
jgi:hypothetical protein